MRWSVVAFAATALMGCNSLLPIPADRSVERLALSGASVTAQGPQGYCVDTVTSRPAQGFALIAACSTLSGEGTLPWRNAVIAVQVGDAGSAAITGAQSEMAAFLATPDAALLLSRSGDAAAIAVRGAQVSGDAVTVVFTDAGPVPIPGTQQAEWRGFLDINGRLVTVSLRGLAAEPLGEAAGLSLLRDAIAALRLANVDAT